MDHTREMPIGATESNDKNSLQGNIAELGNNVYEYGTRDQGEKVHENDIGNSGLCGKRVQ
jgi:transcriptional regulator with AAA-type ATPase domain